MKLVNHQIRRRITRDCSSPKLTDQSFKKMCDINNIMAQYAKTGMFTHISKIEPRFLDNTNIPSLEEAFNAVSSAMEMFSQLPPDLRKLMDNDPSKLETFILDENNKDICLKYGLLQQVKNINTNNSQENTDIPPAQ